MNKIDVLVKYFGSPKMTDRNGNSYFHCPFCHHHNNKLTINVEKGVYNCYHCEVRGKSLIYLLKRINVANPNQYKNIFNEQAKINIEDIDNLFGKE